MYENPEVLFGGEDRLLKLVSLIYDAVDQPSLWPQVMDGIAEAANCGITVMFTNYGHACSRDIAALARTDPAYLDLYVQHYESVSPLVALCNRIFPDGAVRYSHLAVPDAEFAKTEFCNDFFGAENYFYSFGIKIPLRNLEPVYLTSARSQKAGPFRKEEGAVLTTLLPHLQRALRLSYELSRLGSSLDAAFAHLPHGLVLLDARGKCILLNKAAKRILDKRDGLLLSQSRLAAEFPSESAQLRAILHRAINPDTTRVTHGNGALWFDEGRGKAGVFIDRGQGYF